jgi:hypothetical protein
MSWKKIFSGKSPSTLPEIDLPKELAKLKAKGWLLSHRKDDTGIGKTVEDCLGIKENNLGEPDCLYQGKEVEIKGRRAKTTSMITLFTLEPSTRHLKDVELMKRYGYKNGNGRQALKITLNPNSFTQQGLKIEVDKITDSISIIDKKGYKPWIWSRSDFHLKLHNLCIVYAYSKNEKEKEYFKIRNAVLATGLDVQKFYDLITKGAVKVDLRMHIKPNGVSRNHGTGFRLANYGELLNCYKKVESILGETTLDARNRE